MEHADKSMDELRARIDELDVQLVRLLNERAQHAIEIGRIKDRLGLDAYSPAREKQVMQNVTRDNPGPLSDAAVRRLFERIVDESRTIERVVMDTMRTSPERHP